MENTTHSPRRTRSQGDDQGYVPYSGLNYNTLGKCYLQVNKITVYCGEQVVGLQGRLRYRDVNGVLTQSKSSNTGNDMKSVNFQISRNEIHIIPCRKEINDIYLLNV